MAEDLEATMVSVDQINLSSFNVAPKFQLLWTEGPNHSPKYWYSVTVPGALGMYEDASGWLYCSIFLRLWFFKCVV